MTLYPIKTIEFKAVYAGTLTDDGAVTDSPSEEIISVEARDINGGFRKASLKAWSHCNGQGKQIHSVEFWQVR